MWTNFAPNSKGDLTASKSKKGTNAKVSKSSVRIGACQYHHGRVLMSKGLDVAPIRGNLKKRSACGTRKEMEKACPRYLLHRTSLPLRR